VADASGESLDPENLCFDPSWVGRKPFSAFWSKRMEDNHWCGFTIPVDQLPVSEMHFSFGERKIWIWWTPSIAWEKRTYSNFKI
jgi:hypothetical protein